MKKIPKEVIEKLRVMAKDMAVFLMGNHTEDEVRAKFKEHEASIAAMEVDCEKPKDNNKEQDKLIDECCNKMLRAFKETVVNKNSEFFIDPDKFKAQEFHQLFTHIILNIFPMNLVYKMNKNYPFSDMLKIREKLLEKYSYVDYF